MRTVILSDTHLTHHFDDRKYRLLRRLVERADKLYLNGDIWDAFHTNWGRFSQSSWKYLFPLLRAKRATYIFGNHDLATDNPEPWKLATAWGEHAQIPWKHGLLHIEHGHRLGPSFDMRHPVLANLLHEIIPYRRWSFQDNEWNRRADREMRLVAQQQFSPEKLLLVGHSHLPGLHPKDNYLNSGFIYDGQATWLEIEGNKLRLHQAKY